MIPLDINNKFERRHLLEQQRITSNIASLWDDFMREVALVLIRRLPATILNQQLNTMLSNLAAQQTLIIQAGIQLSWQISHQKTFAFLDKRLQGVKDIPQHVRAIWYDPNNDALQQFISRKEKGLGLSENVWKQTSRAQKLINDVATESVGTGESAAKMAKKVREALVSEVKTPSPGRGVYRSPVKNTQRLARTVTNTSYREADQAAWDTNPLVLGYKIQLSKSGKPKIRCEVCRSLEGTYPNSFKWAGWHPQCLCFKVPILMNRAQMDEYIELIRSGQDSANAVEAIRVKAGLVKSVPGKFKSYLNDNYERIQGWKSTPYWLRDNKSIVNNIIKDRRD